MPPVELNTVPVSEVSRQTFSDLKLVDKAMEIPVVSDTFSELEKVKNTLSENQKVQTVKTFMEDGLQKLKDSEKVKDIVDNETLNKSVSTVKDAVLPKVTGALDKLDHLACDGIDSLTHAIPALNTSTPELYQSTRDAAKGYFLWATEYAASFTASQVSLSLADTTLSVAEKLTGFVKPTDKEDQGLASTTYSRIRTLRRTVRSVKRAGAKRNQPAVKPKSLEETGFVGRLASMFYVNTILSVLGLKLAPAATSKETKEKRTGEPLDDSYTSIHDLKGDLDGYKSEEDPDYEPESDEESVDGSVADEAEEILREEYTSEESEGEESAQEDDRVQDEVVHEDDGCDEEGTCALEARL